MNGLRLDVSIGREKYDAMEETYRNEGLSVGVDHMRLYGEDIQLEVAFTDLILGNRIGQGACSSVNMARHRRTGEVYAIKMFNVYDKGQASQLYNEILLLTSFQCDALISLKGAFHDEGSIGVIIEYMDKGSLEFIMEERIEINERVMAGISFQILWGLGYLHYEKQIHRDVKPGNILMNSLGQVKLSDFGISKELDNSIAMSNTSVGSYRYMSPERLKGEKYDAAGDVWSVGISIIELWEKRYPFLHVADTPISLLGELERVSFSRLLSRSTVGYSALMRDFILATLEMDTHRRPGAADLMSSQWFEAMGTNNLIDAQAVVAHWVNALARKPAKTSGGHGNIPRGPPVVAGRPLRKDANEMSISMESSRSSAAGGNNISTTITSHASSHSEDMLNTSRDRMNLSSNNPFTSSGSFNFNSSSFSGASASFNSSGGANNNPTARAIHAASNTTAASRYRMAYGIGDAAPEERDEYEEDEFEEEVETYEHDGHHGYDYKASHQEEKKDSRSYSSSNGRSYK